MEGKESSLSRFNKNFSLSLSLLSRGWLSLIPAKMVPDDLRTAWTPSMQIPGQRPPPPLSITRRGMMYACVAEKKLFTGVPRVYANISRSTFHPEIHRCSIFLPVLIFSASILRRAPPINGNGVESR